MELEQIKKDTQFIAGVVVGAIGTAVVFGLFMLLLFKDGVIAP